MSLEGAASAAVRILASDVRGQLGDVRGVERTADWIRCPAISTLTMLC
jgi:hypothetical protein